MKKVVDNLFTIILVFVVFYSIKFTLNLIDAKQQMNEMVDFENNQVLDFKEFISESKNKLNEYKLVSNSNEDFMCISEIDKAIDYIYSLAYPGKNLTYKEWMDYYYSKISDTNYRDLNVLNVSKVCNVDKKGSLYHKLIVDETKATIEKQTEFNQLRNVFINDNNFSLTFISALFSISDRGAEYITNTTNDVLIYYEDYINKLLQIVGDRYE